MGNNKVLARIIFGSGLAIMLFIFYIIGNNNKNEFKKQIVNNIYFLNGVVDGTEQKYKDAFKIRYHFSFKGKEYIQSQAEINSSSFFADKYSSIKNIIINKSFPVIIDSMNPDINQMLVIPNDFEFYNIPFPDSLQWVKKLIDENQVM